MQLKVYDSFLVFHVEQIIYWLFLKDKSVKSILLFAVQRDWIPIRDKNPLENSYVLSCTFQKAGLHKRHQNT